MAKKMKKKAMNMKISANVENWCAISKMPKQNLKNILGFFLIINEYR